MIVSWTLEEYPMDIIVAYEISGRCLGLTVSYRSKEFVIKQHVLEDTF